MSKVIHSSILPDIHFTGSYHKLAGKERIPGEGHKDQDGIPRTYAEKKSSMSAAERGRTSQEPWVTCYDKQFSVQNVHMKTAESVLSINKANKSHFTLSIGAGQSECLQG